MSSNWVTQDGLQKRQACVGRGSSFLFLKKKKKLQLRKGGGQSPNVHLIWRCQPNHLSYSANSVWLWVALVACEDIFLTEHHCMVVQVAHFHKATGSSLWKPEPGMWPKQVPSPQPWRDCLCSFQHPPPRAAGCESSFPGESVISPQASSQYPWRSS